MPLYYLVNGESKPYNVDDMDSTISKNTYKAIYRLLDRVSPLTTDCGQLCGAVCCNIPEADAGAQLGMYLLPGEEQVFTQQEDWLTWSTERAEDYTYPESWSGDVYFIQCRGDKDCDRAIRPIQCRTFPLEPFIDEQGYFKLILYPGRLRYTCPLIAGRLPLEERFYRATYTVWKRLLQDRRIYDLIKQMSDLRGRAGIEMIEPNIRETDESE